MQQGHGSRTRRRTPHQRVRLWILLGFSAAVAMLGWATLEAWRQSRAAAATSQWVDHTLLVLNTTQRFETTLLAMESDHRAYLVRGDETFAARREAQGAVANGLLGELRGLTRDNAAQLGRLREVERLLQARLDTMHDVSALIESDGINAGREIFRPQGQGSIVPLQQLLGDVRDSEEQLLEARTQASRTAAQRLRWSLLYGPGVGVLLVLAGFFALMRQLEQTDRARRGLAAASALQQTMLDSGGLIIIATAVDGRITLFNRAASDALGYAPEEMIGKATPAKFHDTEEVAARALALSRELGVPVAPGFDVFTALPQRGKPEQRVWTYVRRDGSRFPVHLVVSAFRDDDGEPLGYIGMGQDITERVAAERDIHALNHALVQRQQALEESVRDLESFSYSVSHDLRAPLRHIDGYARMLREDAGDTLDAECDRYLDEIGGSSRRMGRLIDDLLMLSRLGRTALKSVAVDMNALVRDACVDVDFGTQPKSVIQFSNLPPCVGDPALLRQVWVNLLSNAVKYSAPRGIAAQVQVEGTRLDETIRYKIMDNGVGFDMRYVDKLFGVFQRLHTQEEFEGTGVGLAIVRRVVTRHGGSVHARSRVGEGAEFWFELPLAPPA